MTLMGEPFLLRLQLRGVEGEIIHSSDTQDADTRESRADSVHEGTAGRAEVVGHGVSLSVCGILLAVGLEVLLTAEVL